MPAAGRSGEWIEVMPANKERKPQLAVPGMNGNDHFLPAHILS